MRTLFAVVFLGTALSAGAATQGGSIPTHLLPLFPPNNWWNIDISAAPVDPGSAGFINFIQSIYAEPRGLPPDFGGDAGGDDVYGAEYTLELR